MKLTVITVLICGLCIALAIGAGAYFVYKTRALINDIKAAQSSSGTPTKMRRTVSEYYKTLQAPSNKTTEYAEDYINLDSLAIDYKINFKVIRAIPNLLTSIGILGTFLGLTLALIDFNSASTAEIRTSIDSLLGGMSTAFWTSLVGMGASAAFLFAERMRMNRIEAIISEFASSLDSQYHISNDQVLVNAFSFNGPNGALVSPGQALSGLTQSVHDLGNTITSAIIDAMDDAFQTKLVPIINDLSIKMENPAKAVIDSLVKELQNICENFKNGLTKEVSDKMTELMQKFIIMAEAIDKIPETIEVVNNGILDASRHTIDANKEVSGALEEQAMRITDLNEEFTGTLTKVSDSVKDLADVADKLKQMPDALQKAADTLTDSADNTERANEEVKKLIEKIDNAHEATRNYIEQFTNDLNSIESGIKTIFDEINIGLNQYSTAARDGLQTMLDPFTGSVTEASEKIANSIAPLSDAVNELGNFGDTVSQVLKDLEMALRPIQGSIEALTEKADHLNANTI